jgi:hypothetical protein
MGIDPFRAAATQAATGNRPIGDYNLIGDCRTAALIANDGSIDWCCLPDFNAPPVLSRLLGGAQGGYLALTASEATLGPQPIRQRYVPSTAILQTEIRLPSGRLLITDFMPTEHLRGHVTPDLPPRLIRRIEALDGICSFAIRFKVALDYGQGRPALKLNEAGALAVTPGVPGVTFLSFADAISHGRLEEKEQGVFVSDHALKPQERLTLVFGWGRNQRDAIQLQRAFRRDWSYEQEATRGYWQNWAAQTSYFGPYRQTVIRSAITLNLLPFAPLAPAMAASVPPSSQRESQYQQDIPQGIQLRESQDVRISNQKLILRLLREQGSSTRADLARATGLSRTTISTIMTDLINTGLVVEGELVQSTSTGGRRATRVSFRPDAGMVIGAQVSAKKISLSGIDLQGKLLASLETERAALADPFPAILTLAHDVVMAAGFRWEQVAGLGLSVCDGMAPSQLHEDLRRHLHLPISEASPLTLGTYGEQRGGRIPQETPAIYLQLGPEIGFGIICGGTSALGEIFPLVDLLRGQNKEKFSALLHESEGMSATLPASIKPGSPTATALMEQLGDSLADLAQLFHPHLIRIDSEDQTLGTACVDLLGRRLASRGLSLEKAPLSISHTQPGTVALGAAFFALEDVFGSRPHG